MKMALPKVIKVIATSTRSFDYDVEDIRNSLFDTMRAYGDDQPSVSDDEVLDFIYSLVMEDTAFYENLSWEDENGNEFDMRNGLSSE